MRAGESLLTGLAQKLTPLTRGSAQSCLLLPAPLCPPLASRGLSLMPHPLPPPPSEPARAALLLQDPGLVHPLFYP